MLTSPPMANIAPFRALRYDPERVSPAQVVTQPYDKITPEMQEKYYAASPYNLVRIILGQREPNQEGNNVYTRAARFFGEWRRDGVFLQDAQPCLYTYWQRFKVPGSTVEHERRGFIGLGRLEDYSAGVVFRHEQTLAKPRADRLDLLRATRAHFGQIFMLYSDSGDVDGLLETRAAPDIEVNDELGVLHQVWKIADPHLIELVRGKMRDKKLIIADGHHRYETALAYRDERRASRSGTAALPRARSAADTLLRRPEPEDPLYEMVMMTFVNMNSPGLVILPTHRVVHGLPSFSAGDFVQRARRFFNVEEVDTAVDADRCAGLLQQAGRAGMALLAVTRDRDLLLHTPRAGASLFQGFSLRQQSLDVVQLHKVLLENVLALSEESIRNQENIAYVRDTAEALSRVREGGANVAFLMNPVKMEQVRDIAFAGDVLPQKSTDFYPKLLSGLTIYALE